MIDRTKETFLRCRVSDGLFSNERLVEFGDDGEHYVVSATNTREGPDGGLLRVKVLSYEEKLVAILPTNRNCSITIKEEDVVYLPQDEAEGDS